jgi:thioredoxin 1
MHRIMAALALFAAVGMVLAVKQKQAAPVEPDGPAPAAALPRLVDLGAKKCIPCKMMAPILADLTTSMVGRLEVEFIDVWEKPDAAQPYGINLIPTQIFFGPDGRELFRHEGFFSKEDILGTWKDLGFDLSERPAT